uniref:Tetraspannin domain containing protein n=1 Tax=Echinococcus granulosus TaxID=6210 RepID=A0A068WQH3_ECHGR|nr:Tetraspannin domain containing protein [Echinococcus granulosus]
MGCALSCGLKFAVHLFNAILCKMLDVSMVQPEHMHELVHFIAGNVGGIACILVVASFCIAALCLIGCISSCCGCNLLFKIYSAILAALLLAQIIAVIVIFPDPHRLAAAFVESTKELLAFYGNDTRPGEAVSAIWSATMG